MTTENSKLSSFVSKSFETSGAIFNWSKNVVSNTKVPEVAKDYIYKGVGAADSLMKVSSSAISNYVPEDSKILKKSFDVAGGLCKSGKVFSIAQGNNLKVKITNSGKVLVGYKSAKSSIFRLDRAHPGADFNHININPKFSGLRKDPHVPLPPGGLAVRSLKFDLKAKLNSIFFQTGRQRSYQNLSIH